MENRLLPYADLLWSLIEDPTSEAIVMVKRREGAVGVHVILDTPTYRLLHINRTVGLFATADLQAILEHLVAAHPDYDGLAPLWVGKMIPDALRDFIVAQCAPIEWKSELAAGTDLWDKFSALPVPGHVSALTAVLA